MCELPRRSWHDFAPPSRVAYAVFSLAALGLALVAGKSWDSRGISWALVCLGGALGIVAVLLPTVQQLEFGFPVGLRVVAAVNNREARLLQAFESQRPEFELCIHLLCRDPDRAARLLEAAWARTAAEWQRPVGPALRSYSWCTLMHLLDDNRRMFGDDSGQPTLARATPFDRLDYPARVLVVLHSFGHFTTEELAGLLGREKGEIDQALAEAEAAIATVAD